MLDLISSYVTGGKGENAMHEAADQALGLQNAMYNQQRADLQPWREAGTRALGKMEDADYMRDFTAADMQVDPGYQFRMEEGQKALERSASARGNMFGGAQAKALTKYGQDMGAQEYQASYDRFNADRDRRFGRLNTLSGGGLQAAGGMASAAQNMANSGSEAMYGKGNATAARWKDMNNSVAQFEASNKEMAGNMMGMFAMCDERLKTDIREVSPEQVKEFRKAFRPFLFRYISGEHGEGEFVGPMTQHLERSELGRRIVVENEKGEKMIDLGRAVMLLLAIEGAA